MSTGAMIHMNTDATKSLCARREAALGVIAHCIDLNARVLNVECLAERADSQKMALARLALAHLCDLRVRLNTPDDDAINAALLLAPCWSAQAKAIPASRHYQTINSFKGETQ